MNDQLPESTRQMHLTVTYEKEREGSKRWFYRIDSPSFYEAVKSSGLAGQLTMIAGRLPDKDKAIPNLEMHESAVPHQSVDRRVPTCVFRAVEEYVSRMFGGRLDSHDEEWFTAHSLVSTSGVHQSHATTVIHQLVEPYGLGVSRVRVQPGCNRAVFQDLLAWTAALGANPLWIGDGQTTNEEALKTLAGDDPTILAVLREDPWGVDCSQIPLRPSIMLDKFSNTTGHNGGAWFASPRSNTDGFIVCIQLDRLERIHYRETPKLVPYQAIYEEEPDWWEIKDPTSGKPLRDLQRKEWFVSRPKRRQNNSCIVTPGYDWIDHLLLEQDSEKKTKCKTCRNYVDPVILHPVPNQPAEPYCPFCYSRV